ncbi:hypothetical protein N9948_01590 [bacterium]|nr:hypothetical protein [bacterium]
METTEYIQKIRKASQAVYLACEESVAKDISEMLQWSANELESKDKVIKELETATEGYRYRGVEDRLRTQHNKQIDTLIRVNSRDIGFKEEEIKELGTRCNKWILKATKFREGEISQRERREIAESFLKRIAESKGVSPHSDTDLILKECFEYLARWEGK